jgi:glycosyltransferase involved in cell wall biosynthesis
MRFSVVIPVYNREQYIKESINSVFAQTFIDFELIVMDDGSTDGTADAIASYGPRLKAMSQANSGSEQARYHAAKYAQGEYLVFLDSDDILCSRALETYDRIIRECGAPPLIIATWITFWDGSNLPSEVAADAGSIEVSVYRDFFSKDVKMSLSNSLIIIEKQAFNKLEGARERSSPDSLLDDFHLCFQAGTLSPCVVIRRPLTLAYRRHSGNIHQNGRAMLSSILFLMEHEHRGRYPGGKSRQKERYLWIGSIGLHWIRKWLAVGSLELIYPLLRPGAAMLGVAGFKKLASQIAPVRPEPSRVLLESVKSLSA